MTWIIRLLCLTLCGYVSAEQLQVAVEAEAAILMNADTGAVLFEKKSREIMYPASVTKIATALYTLEKSGAKLDALTLADQECVGFITEAAKKRSNYSLPPHYLEFGATHVVIHKGERLPLRDLLNAMMIHSADDASNVIAQHVGGSIPRFMQDLNRYLQELGCKDTYFNNPHGLHHPDHVTTAFDMATLTAQALKNRTFREIVATTQCTRPRTEFQAAMTLVQSNRLLRKGEYYYPKAIGVKTGFTGAAQNTFVAAAQSNGRTLVAVLLKTKDRKDMFKDAIKLFETAFNQPMLELTIMPAGALPYVTDVKGGSRAVQASLLEPLTLQYYPAEEPQVSANLQWHNLSLPIEKGQEVGQIVLATSSGQTLKTVPILAAESVSGSLLARTSHMLANMSLFGWIFCTLLVVGLIALMRWRS